MLVLGAVVGGFVLVRDLNRSDPASPVRPVDYRETVDFARAEADFPLLAPETLPDGWRATSARFNRQTKRWHLGVLTDADRYVGLEQARSPLEKMVETYVDPAAVRGRPVSVDGEPWTTWTDDGGDSALARSDDGVTVLVVGTAGEDELVDYTASLR